MPVEDILRMLPDPDVLFPCPDTPYSERCKTNYAASGDEIHEVRKIISDYQAQVGDIGTIMHRMTVLASQLDKKRDHIRSLMRRHQGLLSCLRRLPPEILGEIFAQCMPSGTHINPDARREPLKLTRVCKNWRNVALGTPKLWSSLSLSGLSQSWKEPQHDLVNYRDWLSRTKDYPLSLEVFLYHSSKDHNRRDEVLQLLRPHTGRIARLRAEFDQAAGLDVLFDNMPLAECLILKGNKETMSGAETISIVQPQPRLRMLVLHSIPYSIDILSSPGWAHLTTLGLQLRVNQDHGIDDQMFFTLLQCCFNLESFVCSPVCVKHNNPFSLTHSKLRSLDIAGLYDAGSFLDKLTLPSLCYLEIHPYHEGDPIHLLEEMAILVSEQADRKAWDMEVLGMADVVSTVQPRFRPCDVSINFRSINAGDILTMINPGWMTLTHLRMGSTDDDIFWTLLLLCPNLVYFDFSSLHFSSHHRKAAQKPGSVTHSLLRSLFVHFLDFSAPMLTLPDLRILDISWSFSPLRHGDFMDFLSRSRCPLKKVCIADYKAMDKEQVMEIPMSIPTLEHLHLRGELQGGSFQYIWHPAKERNEFNYTPRCNRELASDSNSNRESDSGDSDSDDNSDSE